MELGVQNINKVLLPTLPLRRPQGCKLSTHPLRPPQPNWIYLQERSEMVKDGSQYKDPEELAVGSRPWGAGCESPYPSVLS